MASLNEIVARSRTIAEGRGADPHQNPIIDAGMTAEALVPHAIRFVIEHSRDALSTTADHEIEVDSGGLGDLPDGVVRGCMDASFLPETPKSAYVPYPDYNRSQFTNLLCYFTTKNAEFLSNCVPGYGDIVRSIASITKSGASNAVTAGAGTGLFVALNDVGRRLVGTRSGVEVLNAIIEERVSTDVVNVRDYRTGSVATVLGGVDPLTTANVHETALELIRTFTTVSKSGATQTITTADAGSDDIGRLITVEVAGVIVIRAIITAVPTSEDLTIAGYAPDAVTLGTGTARIYRILDPVITLNVPSVPTIPADADDEITAMSPELAENVILVIAGAMTGEISIAVLLGQKGGEA